jgi:hypothetical protein
MIEDSKPENKWGDKDIVRHQTDLSATSQLLLDMVSGSNFKLLLQFH